MRERIDKGQPQWVFLEAGKQLKVLSGNIWLVDHRGQDRIISAGQSWRVGISQKYLLSTFQDGSQYRQESFEREGRPKIGPRAGRPQSKLFIFEPKPPFCRDGAHIPSVYIEN
jgi:hypothetical protein